MFKKFFDEIMQAKTAGDLVDALYRRDGVDNSYQHGKLSREDHERLFALAGMVMAARKL